MGNIRPSASDCPSFDDVVGRGGERHISLRRCEMSREIFSDATYRRDVLIDFGSLSLARRLVSALRTLINTKRREAAKGLRILSSLIRNMFSTLVLFLGMLLFYLSILRNFCLLRIFSPRPVGNVNMPQAISDSTANECRKIH